MTALLMRFLCGCCFSPVLLNPYSWTCFKLILQQQTSRISEIVSTWTCTGALSGMCCNVLMQLQHWPASQIRQVSHVQQQGVKLEVNHASAYLTVFLTLAVEPVVAKHFCPQNSSCGCKLPQTTHALPAHGVTMDMHALML